MTPVDFWAKAAKRQMTATKAALDANAAVTKAAKRQLTGTKAALDANAAMTKAARANLKLAADWARLWGIK